MMGGCVCIAHGGFSIPTRTPPSETELEIRRLEGLLDFFAEVPESKKYQEWANRVAELKRHEG